MSTNLLYHGSGIVGYKYKGVLKGTRWLLLKNPENLDPEKGEHQQPQEALKTIEPLTIAYYLKEELRLLWKQPNKSEAEIFLQQWVAKAESKIQMLTRFVKTLRVHKFGLLGFYDYPISTGSLEGTNNKRKTRQKQAYGFREITCFSFKLKIYALHETKNALVG